MSETSKAHKEKAQKKLNFCIYICSTSRYKQIQNGETNVSDIGGDTLETLIKNAGHKVLF
jgi:molybdopterin biosynthesis enzyme MoaB